MKTHNNSNQQPHIIIAGGGVSGLELATYLGKTAKQKRASKNHADRR